LKATESAWNIIVVGYWNRSIFTTDWITKNIFKSNECILEFPSNPALPQRFSTNTNNITIIPSSSRLVVMPRILNDETLIIAATYTKDILKLLNQTPVSAIGINFGFTEDNPEDDLLSIFPNKDVPQILDQEFEINTQNLERLLIYENEKQLKLSIKKYLNIIDINFNFNFDIKTAKSAIDLLENGILIYRNKAISFLEKVYNININEVEI